MKLTIPGRAFSKKNSRKFIRMGRMIVSLPSNAYTRFEKETIEHFLDEGMIQVSGVDDKKKPIYASNIGTFTEKVFINYVFHLKGLGNQDGDNIQAGINDILEVAGFLSNDRNMREWHGKIVENSPEWKTEIEIIPMVLNNRSDTVAGYESVQTTN